MSETIVVRDRECRIFRADDEQIDDLRIVRAGYEPPHGKVLLVVESA